MEMNEAIEVIKRNYPHVTESGSQFETALRLLIPELKESKDEKIRKELLNAFQESEDSLYMVLTPNRRESFIAWLEKQGEHANFRNKIQIGDKVTRNEDGMLVNMSQFKRIAKRDEKQGEQKPADKVESKFHEGDWVVSPNGVYWHIDKISNNRYEVTSNTGESSNWNLDTNIYHKFTIQEVKDGDVLSYRDGQWIFIYKEKIDDSSFYYHALYSTIHQDLTIDDSGFTLLSDAIVPATNEERNVLEKAMVNAGYIFDFDKKELKKIKQKSAESNDIKSVLLVHDEILNNLLERYKTSATFKTLIVNLQNWWNNTRRHLLSFNIEQKNAWSKEDVLMCAYNGVRRILDNKCDYLAERSGYKKH